MGVKRINKRRMEELREEVGVREPHEEAGEEPVKVGWTRGKNGYGAFDEESRCAYSGRKKEKMKTKIDLTGMENKSEG